MRRSAGGGAIAIFRCSLASVSMPGVSRRFSSPLAASTAARTAATSEGGAGRPRRVRARATVHSAPGDVTSVPRQSKSTAAKDRCDASGQEVIAPAPVRSAAT